MGYFPLFQGLVKPKNVINDELDRHTDKLFGLLEGMMGNPESFAKKVQNELKKHKREMQLVVEENAA